MPIDLTRFHAVFLAESLEQLDAMEAELLRPQHEIADHEAINQIFRAAHTIKGGSATFGFTGIAGLTHILETLLDQVRDGTRSLNQGLVDLLLESVDCLREVLLGHQSGNLVAEDGLAAVQSRLEVLAGLEAGWQSEDAGAPADSMHRWHIRFAPHTQMLARGNDPYRLLRELAELGEMTASADLSRLPGLAEMDPESCYLSWRIVLASTAPKQDIDELFEWVAGDCDLDIRVEASADRRTEDNDADPLSAIIQNQTGVAKRTASAASGTAGGSIRVSTDKIDQLINLVGELVITESMLRRLVMPDETTELDPVQEALMQLSSNVMELQDRALKMRMLPISFCFARLPRIVHEIGRELGKDAILELRGEQTEVDKTVLEKISDPLIHLVRNAIDHGIESKSIRLAAGKPARATIAVEVFHQGGNVIVNVSDDGGGLDAAAILKRAVAKGLVEDGVVLPEGVATDLIFKPGFSTASTVTDVSGRGVGLDIVRRNIESLGGHVEVESKPGRGTRFSIALPLTLAIIDGQLVRLGDAVYIVPLLAIIENCRVQKENFKSVGGDGTGLYQFRDEIVPVLDLARVWRLGEAQQPTHERPMIIVESSGRHIGLLVDELLSQQQAVIKSLEQNFRAVTGLSGATILGDGTVALILDIPGLVKMVVAQERGSARTKVRPATE